jgi:hypothetical protein
LSLPFASCFVTFSIAENRETAGTFVNHKNPRRMEHAVEKAQKQEQRAFSAGGGG